MSTLLDFQFLMVLNALTLLLWPTSAPYTGDRRGESGDRRGALGIIMLILTVIAVVLDIVFIVLKLVH